MVEYIIAFHRAVSGGVSSRMQAYLYLTKMRILATLAYRFEVFATAITNVVMLTAMVFLWKAAYRGVDTASGLAEHQMITFAILSVLLGSVYSTNVQDKILQQIREGDIAVDLMKPVHLLGCYLAEDVGSAVSSFVNKALPVFLFACLVFQPPLPASWSMLPLFVLSCLLAFAILWLLSALVGMTAFWVMELGNLGMFKDAIVRVLSGSLIPLWFFPDWLQRVSAFLPFPYTYQTPIGIYIGRVSAGEAFFSLIIQAVWIAVLYVSLAAVWKRAKVSTQVQGG